MENRVRRIDYFLLTILSISINLINFRSKEDGFLFYRATQLATFKGSLINLITGGIDPYGIQSVDKPFLAYFLNNLVGKILNLNTFSLSLISFLSITLTSIYLYKIMENFTSEESRVVKLLPSITYLLTPIIVLLNRSNMPDPLLILILTLIFYEITKNKTNVIKIGLLLGLSILVKGFILIPYSFFLLIFLNRKIKIKDNIKKYLSSLLLTILPFLIWGGVYQLLTNGVTTNGKNQFELLFINNGLSRLPFMSKSEIWFPFPDYRYIGFDRLFRDNFIDNWFWLLILSLLGLIYSLKEKKYRGVLPVIHIPLLINFLILSFSGSKICCTHPYYTSLLTPSLALGSSFTVIYIRELIGKKKTKELILTLIILTLLSLYFFDKKIIEIGGDLVGDYRLVVLVNLLIILTLLKIKNLNKLPLTIFLILSLPIQLVSLNNLLNPSPQIMGADLKSGRKMQYSKNYRDDGKNFLKVSQLYPNGRYIKDMNFILGSKYQISDYLIKVADTIPKEITWPFATLSTFNASVLYLKTERATLGVGGVSGVNNVVKFKEFLEMIERNEIYYFVIDPHDLCMVNPNLGYTYESRNDSALILSYVTLHGKKALIKGVEDSSLPNLYRVNPNDARIYLEKFEENIAKVKSGKFFSGMKYCEFANK